mmetsp:Transcript_7867/g.16163  ORF Transcript_7867/g.16163 Transcript_7867/m.16163 type:complete len:226 (-) Transcript_7867:411-1088(-)
MRHLGALIAILEDYLELSPNDQTSPLRTAETMAALSTHFRREAFEEGQVIWEEFAVSQRLYFVERGTIDTFVPLPPSSNAHATTEAGAAAAAATAAATTAGGGGGGGGDVGAALAKDPTTSSSSSPPLPPSLSLLKSGASTRIQRISAGGTCGELGFFLATPQFFRGVASSPGATVAWVLDKQSFLDMQEQHPQLCILVQTAVLKSLCLFDTQQIISTFSSNLLR